MKDIAEYKFKEVLVLVRTKKEWKKFYPLLNTIFQGWQEGHGDNLPFYINLKRDNVFAKSLLYSKWLFT